MGNNVITQYRTTNKLKVLTAVEDLTANTISVINNDAYFPKREKYLFGQHIADNALEAYEKLRFANTIFPESRTLVQERYDTVIESEKDLSYLVSDINMMNSMIKDKDISDEKWYKNLQTKAIDTEKLMKTYRISETRRYQRDIAKFNKSKKKAKSETETKTDDIKENVG